jgi:hypothetical protein
MDYSKINVNRLTLKEKAELVEYLTTDIVIEMKSSAYQEVSDNNKRLAGLMRTFGDTYTGYAVSLKRTVEQSDI